MQHFIYFRQKNTNTISKRDIAYAYQKLNYFYINITLCFIKQRGIFLQLFSETSEKPLPSYQNLFKKYIIDRYLYVKVLILRLFSEFCYSLNVPIGTTYIPSSGLR